MHRSGLRAPGSAGASEVAHPPVQTVPVTEPRRSRWPVLSGLAASGLGLCGPVAGPPCRVGGVCCCHLGLGLVEAARVREESWERPAEAPSSQRPFAWQRDQRGPPNHRGEDTAIRCAGVCHRARLASWAFKGQKFNSNSESEPTNKRVSSPGVKSKSVGRTRGRPRPGAERCC